MKKKKLDLIRETLITLTPDALGDVAGGASITLSTGGGISQTQASLCMPPSRGASICDPQRTRFLCVPDTQQK